MRLLAVIEAVIALASAAVASGATRQKVDSGIRGKATEGPTCPVERYPPDPRCAPRPYRATVRVRRKRTGKLVNTFTARDDGTFKVRLRPGVYRLEPQPGKSGYPWAQPQDVTVRAHRFRHVHIDYDTGLR